MLNGYVSYISAAAMIAYGAGGLILGKLDYDTAVGFITAGLAVFGIRRAIEAK